MEFAIGIGITAAAIGVLFGRMWGVRDRVELMNKLAIAAKLLDAPPCPQCNSIEFIEAWILQARRGERVETDA